MAFLVLLLAILCVAGAIIAILIDDRPARSRRGGVTATAPGPVWSHVEPGPDSQYPTDAPLGDDAHGRGAAGRSS